MTIGSVVAAVAVVAVPMLAAQEAAPPRADTLDLPGAVALARQANPRLAAAGALVEAAAARIRPAGALPDPTLQLGLMNYMLPSLSARRDPLSMNQVTLMQMLPVNGSLGLRRGVARADSARVAFGRDATVLDVERDVRARYWELYHVDRQLDVMERTVTVLRDLADISTTMYTVGGGGASQADVLRAQTAITRMRQEILDMGLQRVAAAAALNAALGRPAETPVALPAAAHAGHGASSIVLTQPDLPPLESLLSQADSGSPAIAAARAMSQGAATNERLVRRMIVPDLSLGVAYGQRVGDNDMVSAMVGVSLPIYAASRQYRMRDEARAMRAASDADVRTMRLAVRALLTTAHAEAVTARQQVASYTGTLLPQAEAGVTAALAAYRVGRADFPAVLDAQMALLEFEHDLHRYEAMYGTAVADIDRLAGRPFHGPSHESGRRSP